MKNCLHDNYRWNDIIDNEEISQMGLTIKMNRKTLMALFSDTVPSLLQRIVAVRKLKQTKGTCIHMKISNLTSINSICLPKFNEVLNIH